MNIELTKGYVENISMKELIDLLQGAINDGSLGGHEIIHIPSFVHCVAPARFIYGHKNNFVTFKGD